MPSMKCGGCAKFLSPAGGAKCSICYAVYHRTCVGLPRGASTASWRCPECTKNARRDNEAETPVRGRSELGQRSGELVSPGTTAYATGEDVPSPAHDGATEHRLVSPGTTSITSPSVADVAVELRLFREELMAECRLMRDEFHKLRTEMSELKDSLRLYSEHRNDLDARVDGLEDKFGQLSDKSESQERTIAELKSQLNERDQDLLLNDIEVSGIPKSKDESTLHIVKLLTTKLGVAVNENDIVHAERVGLTRRNRVDSSEGSANPTPQRPRNLVVRFSRRVTRDVLLREARVGRGLNADELGIGGPSKSTLRIHLNERLTRLNRQIFYKARQAGSLHGWKYIWTKGGKIFARKEDGLKVHRIICEDDIERIFG